VGGVLQVNLIENILSIFASKQYSKSKVNNYYDFNLIRVNFGAAYRSNHATQNRFPIQQGWSEFVDSYRILSGGSGFEADTFTNGTEIVISFAGTDFSQFLNNGSFLGNDFWNGNIPLITGVSINGAAQLVDAVEYYLQIKARVPVGTKITLTGHSLGGALASLVGVFFGETAYTFDQVPAWLTATLGPAQLLRDALIAKGHTAKELANFDSYIQQESLLNSVPNQSLVTNIYVSGEVTRFLPTPNVGTSSGISNNSSGILSGGEFIRFALNGTTHRISAKR
jgi:Lipase (class 3)